MLKKLAIITTHPIQYNAPVFKLLNVQSDIDVKVFYTWEQGAAIYDKGFDRKVEWDIPLLEGYDYEFVSNGGNKKRSFWDLKNPDLINRITSWGAQAIMVYGWNYYSHLKAMRHFKGKIPVYFRGDSTLLNETGGIKTLLRRLFLRWVYSNVDLAFYVGTNNKEYFIAHGLKEKSLAFAPHAIDNLRFANSHSETTINKCKNAFKICDNDIVFMYAGKFEKVKNLENLILAFKNLDKKNLHLILIGNGVLEKNLKILAKENIHFLPFQNQSVMPAFYKLADVFCLTSFSETWGLSVNEAMACGKAVLVSNKVGCAVDLVKEAVNGFIFNVQDRNDLQAKLELLMQDKDKLRLMGNESFKLIENWSYDKVLESMKNTLLNL